MHPTVPRHSDDADHRPQPPSRIRPARPHAQRRIRSNPPHTQRRLTGGHVENPQQTGGWRPMVVQRYFAGAVVIIKVGGDLISSADA